MKKLLLLVLILFLGFSGYIVYNTYFKEKIKVLEVEEEVIDINNIYIYGTHLNIEGSIINEDNLDLVLYNGEFKSVPINIKDNSFNLSDYINEGLFLEDIEVGNYNIFIRSSSKDEEGNDTYKYYTLKNTTDYKETTYYTLSNSNRKIVIKNSEDYSTMMMEVTNNEDEEVYDIVLDPGHGGRDGGASRFGYDEDDFTMQLAVKIKAKLEENGIKVKLTREDGQLSDTEKLPEYGTHGRTAVSYEVNAKYLFSLHLNSNGSTSINGMEVYTAYGVNYDNAKRIVKNIVEGTGLNYSNNGVNKVLEGIYTRTFTEEDINISIKEYEEDNLNPYNITTKTNYYYIIRETGGIITGAYVDDRNTEITANEYCYSNTGAETYLLEMGYISNKSDLDNIVNNIDKYVDSVSKSIIELYNMSN